MKQDTAAHGFLHELGWLGMGFVLPCASLTFYRQAARRRLIWAVLFFLVFSLALTGVMSLGLAGIMASGDIRAPFESGDIPTIVIRDGVARVDGPQPRVLVDDGRTIVMIDTTGTYRQLDRTRYSQGFLLTRTELHVMDNSGDYQVIPLADLQQLFGGEPIVINADTVSRAWQVFTGLFTIVAALLLAVWNILVRFVYVAMLAFVAWGLVSMAGTHLGYGPVLGAGLYALVPAMYLDYLLGRVGVSFIFLQTLILLPIWAIALWAAAPPDDEAAAPPERLLHGWRALAGIPLLLVLAFDVVFHPAYGAALAWAMALVTVAVVAGLGFWASRRQAGPGAAADGAAPATP